MTQSVFGATVPLPFHDLTVFKKVIVLVLPLLFHYRFFSKHKTRKLWVMVIQEVLPYITIVLSLPFSYCVLLEYGNGRDNVETRAIFSTGERLWNVNGPTLPKRIISQIIL